MFFKRPCSIPFLIDTDSSLSTSPYALCWWVLQYWRCLLHQYTITALARTAVVLPTIMTRCCNTGGVCCSSTHGRLSHGRLSCCPRPRPATTASGHARRGARHRSRRVPASAEYQRARLGTRTAWAKFVARIKTKSDGGSSIQQQQQQATRATSAVSSAQPQGATRNSAQQPCVAL